MPESWNVIWPKEGHFKRNKKKRHLGHRELFMSYDSLCSSLNHSLGKENLSRFDLIFVLLLCILLLFLAVQRGLQDLSSLTRDEIGPWQ